jgi:hypothetical protein
MIWFFLWIGLSVVAGVAASSRNRSGIGWFFGSLLISPLLGLILVLVLPPVKVVQRRCPFCSEAIHPDALICPHCRSSLPAPAAKESEVEYGFFGPEGQWGMRPKQTPTAALQDRIGNL